jgi:phage tail-like protein
MAAPVDNYNFFIRLLDAAEAVVSLVENVFGVDIAPDAGFSECRGLEGTMQVEELPEGGLNGGVRKFATRFTWGNLTLSRGVGLSEDLFRWFSSYAQGNGKRRDGVVMLLDDEGDTVAIWRFKRGLPVRWSGPTLSGKGSEVSIESLEIAHEGLELQMNAGLFGPRP